MSIRAFDNCPDCGGRKRIDSGHCFRCDQKQRQQSRWQKIERFKKQATAPCSDGTKAHYWSISAVHGDALLEGRCQRCGQTRMFPAYLERAGGY